MSFTQTHEDDTQANLSRDDRTLVEQAAPLEAEVSGVTTGTHSKVILPSERDKAVQGNDLRLAGNDAVHTNSVDASLEKEDRNVQHDGQRSHAAIGTEKERTDTERLRSLISDKRHGGDSTLAPDGSRPEITTIMDQFKIGQPTTGGDSPGLPVFQYPPRGSSLENRRSSLVMNEPPLGTLKRTDTGAYSVKSQASEKTQASSTVSQPPPPEPDPEPDLPFDFHRFLEQLRHRSADPVAKFLKSFLHEFGKRQWAVGEQMKIVRDFLSFISGRMAQCEVWRSVSDAEFDNAQEGMEKLVMNRLYTQIFSPEISSAESVKIKRPLGASTGAARRGQHQEDVERDDVLAQKISIYGWIREEHLDIKPATDAKSKRFLRLAQQELVKLQNYRAPRDKIICILNCCKVLFGYLRSTKAQQSADDFIPLLIYTVLRAAPEHIVSNVQYIQRFRNPDKLSGEAGYYMSSLLGAVQFIENLDKTSLTISDEDYETNVEQAVAVIAERRSREDARPGTSSLPINEKSGLSRPEVTPRHSLEGEQVNPLRGSRNTQSNANATEGSGEESDENAAVAGLLRTIQKPLSTIGRIFSDDAAASTGHGPVKTPQPGTTPRRSPGPVTQTSDPRLGRHTDPEKAAQDVAMQKTKRKLAVEEAAARQSSAETAEAQRIQRAEHQTVVETLSGMFPDLDRDVISDVVRTKEGRVGLAVDACLALSR